MPPFSRFHKPIWIAILVGLSLKKPEKLIHPAVTATALAAAEINGNRK